ESGATSALWPPQVAAGPEARRARRTRKRDALRVLRVLRGSRLVRVTASVTVFGNDGRADATACGEGAGDAHALRLARGDQVVEDAVGGCFVEDALVPVALQVVLQRLELDAARSRRVRDQDLAEIRL